MYLTQEIPVLLTMQDIAKAHGNSPMRHTRDVILKTPGFPREAPTSSPRKRLWLAREVYDFLNRVPSGQLEKLAEITH